MAEDRTLTPVETPSGKALIVDGAPHERALRRLLDTAEHLEDHARRFRSVARELAGGRIPKWEEERVQLAAEFRRRWYALEVLMTAELP